MGRLIRSRVTGRIRDTDDLSDAKRRYLLDSGRWEYVDEGDPDSAPQQGVANADPEAPVYVFDPDGHPTEVQGPLRPPEVGAGSGRPAWVAYAQSLGIDTEGLKRNDIIAAVKAQES